MGVVLELFLIDPLILILIGSLILILYANIDQHNGHFVFVFVLGCLFLLAISASFLLMTCCSSWLIFRLTYSTIYLPRYLYNMDY